MKKRFLLAISLLWIIVSSAQTETFDIATFIPPKGWQRLDSNNTVVFYDTKTKDGLTSFCQIFLYPSKKSTGKPATDFSAAWKDIVVKNTRTKAKPQVQTEKTPDGWTVTTGAANISMQSMTFKCMLVNISGFNKAMSVMTFIAGNDHQTALESFFNTHELNNK